MEFSVIKALSSSCTGALNSAFVLRLKSHPYEAAMRRDHDRQHMVEGHMETLNGCESQRHVNSLSDGSAANGGSQRPGKNHVPSRITALTHQSGRMVCIQHLDVGAAAPFPDKNTYTVVERLRGRFLQHVTCRDITVETHHIYRMASFPDRYFNVVTRPRSSTSALILSPCLKEQSPTLKPAPLAVSL